MESGDGRDYRGGDGSVASSAWKKLWKGGWGRRQAAVGKGVGGGRGVRERGRLEWGWGGRVKEDTEKRGGKGGQEGNREGIRFSRDCFCDGIYCGDTLLLTYCYFNR